MRGSPTPEALGRCVHELLEDRGRRRQMAQCARERVVELSWQRSASDVAGRLRAGDERAIRAGRSPTRAWTPLGDRGPGMSRAWQVLALIAVVGVGAAGGLCSWPRPGRTPAAEASRAADRRRRSAGRDSRRAADGAGGRPRQPALQRAGLRRQGRPPASARRSGAGLRAGLLRSRPRPLPDHRRNGHRIRDDDLRLLVGHPLQAAAGRGPVACASIERRPLRRDDRVRQRTRLSRERRLLDGNRDPRHADGGARSATSRATR